MSRYDQRDPGTDPDYCNPLSRYPAAWRTCAYCGDELNPTNGLNPNQVETPSGLRYCCWQHAGLDALRQEKRGGANE